MKIALLMMAIFLWFFVVTSREYTHVLTVPIRLMDMMEGKVLLEDPDSHADVLFRGEGTSLILLSLFGDARLELDLSSINFFYDYTVQIDQVRWAPGINVEILQILRPDTVYIRLDDEIEKNLPIRSMLSVTTAENYAATESVQLEPDSVLVRGGKSILEHLRYIPTQVKIIERANNSINTKLDLIPPEGSNIILYPKDVKAFVNVEKLETRLFSAIPVIVLNPLSEEQGFYEPSTIDVQVRGLKSRLDEIDRSEIIVSISLEGNPSGAGVFTPVILLPEGIELIEFSPDSVRINYEEVDT